MTHFSQLKKIGAIQLFCISNIHYNNHEEALKNGADYLIANDVSNLNYHALQAITQGIVTALDVFNEHDQQPDFFVSFNDQHMAFDELEILMVENPEITLKEILTPYPENFKPYLFEENETANMKCFMPRWIELNNRVNRSYIEYCEKNTLIGQSLTARAK